MEIGLDTKIQELMPHLSTMHKGASSIAPLTKITEKLIALYPQEAKTHALRGDVLFYAGELNDSEQAYEKAIQLDDRKYTLWDQWMVNLWQNEKYTKLETVSYDAIDLFPNQVNAFILHALSLKKNNKDSEAMDYFEEAGFIAGKNTTLKSAVELAKNWSNKSDLDKASVNTFLSDLATDKFNNPIYLELIGDLYAQINDMNKSKKFWQMAIDMGAKESKIKKKMGA
jgi:tetratricopeptide (TPR) repeat protein